MKTFPRPPGYILDALYPTMEPAPELKEWALATFVHVGGPLQNPDHEHLNDAQLLFLWSSHPFRKGGREVVGTCQLGRQQGSLGKKELLEQRYREWHGGSLPDFVITICAPFVLDATPATKCALIEHELLHASQERDEFGDPKFNQDTGLPCWTMRPHDLEVFISEVARYGAYSPELRALKTVLDRGPLVADEEVSAVCGCGAKIGALRMA